MTLKEMTRTRRAKFGTFLVEFATPGIGHILKNAGCDFVLFDLEHSGFSIETTKIALRYFEAAGLPVIAGMPSKDPQYIHRTLDLGYFDAQGRLWLTGRVPDRVETEHGVLAPLPLEAQLNDVPGVRRSALIAHANAPRGEMLVELEENAPEGTLEICQALMFAAELPRLPVVQVDEIPVDPRHFSKLDRPTLRSLRGAP